MCIRGRKPPEGVDEKGRHDTVYLGGPAKASNLVVPTSPEASLAVSSFKVIFYCHLTRWLYSIRTCQSTLPLGCFSKVHSREVNSQAILTTSSSQMQLFTLSRSVQVFITSRMNNLTILVSR